MPLTDEAISAPHFHYAMPHFSACLILRHDCRSLSGGFAAFARLQCAARFRRLRQPGQPPLLHFAGSSLRFLAAEASRLRPVSRRRVFTPFLSIAPRFSHDISLPPPILYFHAASDTAAADIADTAAISTLLIAELFTISLLSFRY
jgi:hypothetical protein